MEIGFPSKVFCWFFGFLLDFCLDFCWFFYQFFRQWSGSDGGAMRKPGHGDQKFLLIFLPVE